MNGCWPSCLGALIPLTHLPSTCLETQLEQNKGPCPYRVAILVGDNQQRKWVSEKEHVSRSTTADNQAGWWCGVEGV